jgi:hypothetical protein
VCLPENARTAKEPSPRAVAGKDKASSNEEGANPRFIGSDSFLSVADGISDDTVTRIGVSPEVGAECRRRSGCGRWILLSESTRVLKIRENIIIVEAK